jgi:hypothetical protein
MTIGERDRDRRDRRRGGAWRVRAAGTAFLVAGALALVPAGPAPAAEPADPVVAMLSAGLTPEQRAELAFLRHLGWRFVFDAGAKTPDMRVGTPCFRRDIEAAWAAGDLTVNVPPAMTREQIAAFGASLAPLVESIPTRCAYRQKLAVATREATRKLAAVAERGAYVFPKILFVNSPVFRCTLPRPEWRKVGVENLCTGSTAKAIEAVYERGGVAECYTGQWVALFATQYELYGAEWFDREFRADELRLGRPREAVQTAIGAYADEKRAFTWRALVIPEARMRDDPTLVLGELGPKAFVGVTGILQNEAEDPTANQNVLITSITPRAVEEFRTRGGLGRILEITREANEARKASRRGTSGSERAGHLRRYEELLADPVMSELMVYVQPLGVVPFAKVADKEMYEDGKPVKLRIYTNGLDEYFYQRYRAAWKARWLREQGLAAPPTAPPAPAPVVPRHVPAR